MKKTSLYLTIVAIHIAIPCFLVAQAGCSSTEEKKTPPAAAASTEEVTTISTEDKNVAEPADNKLAEGSPTLRAEPTKPTWNMAPVAQQQQPAPAPADDDFVAPMPKETKKPQAQKEEAGHSLYTVKKGDTISKIAARHGTTSKKIMELNSVKNANSIKIGQKLKLPADSAADVVPAEMQTAAPAPFSEAQDLSEYVVVRGDSLSVIAVKTGTSVSQLMKINNLKNANIRVGQKLSVKKSAGKPAAEKHAAKATAAKAVKTEAGEVEYKVKSGEFLGMIAAKYSVSVADIKKRNNISDPRKIRAGQTLVIPVKGAKAAAAKAEAKAKPEVKQQKQVETPAAPEAPKAPAAPQAPVEVKKDAEPVILPEAPKAPAAPQAPKAEENLQVIEL